MEQQRLILEPGVISRLAGSMESIARAWQSDVDVLRETEAKLASTERLLHAASDRAGHLQGDLEVERAEIRDLLRRNAHLEAQLQKLMENSIDAGQLLGAIAVRANESIRQPDSKSQPEKPPVRADGTVSVRPSPVVPIRAQPQRLEEASREGDRDDGTGLPKGAPAFLRTALPVNQFSPMAAE